MMTPVTRCLALLALLSANGPANAQPAVAPSSAPASMAAPQPATEVLEYRTVDASGAVLGTARVELSTGGSRVALTEKRQNGARGRSELYRVAFDRTTLAPLDWYRRSSDGQQISETALALRNGQIAIATNRPEAATEHQTLPLPAAPYVVEPLIKFHLAAAIDRGERSGLFRAVVASEQLTDAVELRFTDLGIETVTVGAGTYRCHRIKVEPTAVLYSAIMPAGEMYFAVDGHHTFVLGTGQAHRLGGVVRTELVAQRWR